MVKSIDKGKAGEREAAKAIQEYLGVEAHRGKQYQGGEDSPDIKTALEGVHFEVKRVEALQLYKAMEQAKSESGAEEVPVVLHRKNREEWVAIVALADLRRLAELIYTQTE